MRYKCVEETFYDRVYKPGDVYLAIPNEEKLFKGNPCWEEIPESGGKTQIKLDKKGSGK